MGGLRETNGQRNGKSERRLLVQTKPNSVKSNTNKAKGALKERRGRACARKSNGNRGWPELAARTSVFARRRRLFEEFGALISERGR